MRERATKRKLPFTVGANGEQKDSDTGTWHLALPMPLPLSPVPLLPPDCLQVILTWPRPTSHLPDSSIESVFNPHPSGVS